MTGEEPPRTGGGRLLVVLTGLFLLLAGAGAWIVHRRDETGRARAGLLGRINADLRGEIAALEAAEPAVPDGENAAVGYERAAALLSERGSHLVRKLDFPWESTPKDLAAYVEDHGPAMAIVESSARMDRCRFPLPPTGSGLLGHPYGSSAQMRGYHDIPALFAARARIRIEQGEVGAALGDALLVPRIVRHFLHRNVRDPEDMHEDFRWCGEVLERVLRHPGLDAATARRAAGGILEWGRVLESDGIRRRIEVLQTESQATILLSGAGSTEYSDRLRAQFGLPPAGFVGSLWGTGDPAGLAPKREEWVAIREAARLGEFPKGPPPAHLGQLTVLRAALAIRARQLEAGAPPARLEDLVPDLLPAVPQDPWGTGPLRYEVRGDAWTVESVGQVKVQKRSPSGDFEMAPLDLRIEWPPKPELPR